MNHKWLCIYNLINNHLEFVYDTKEKADEWLNFWKSDPKCFVLEVIE